VTNYSSGRRYEWKTQRVLEAAGYVTLRTAGSHGAVDVIGISASDIVLVQVKSGPSRPPVRVFEELREMKRPVNTRVLLHWWKPRAHEPVVFDAYV